MINSVHRPKTALQIAVAFFSLVPLSAGLAGIVMGPSFVMVNENISLDSHFRYLSGLLLGIGLGFLSTLPSIELKSARFQLLTALVFVGGLSRLVSLLMMGVPGTGMIFGLVMELVVTPLLAFAQHKLSQRFQTSQRSPLPYTLH
jgi:hypothetical protein